MSASSAATELHPLLAHHILNTLEWPDLRPLQKDALRPILAGGHALLVAPTAGGKTEAAVFPILSRMLYEDWTPLSVLYLCPLRALLNNLHPRLEHYAGLLGRTAGLWHGDVGESAREQIRQSPPDILMTTPESVEAMLISRRTDHQRFFRHVRTLIVDEIHAFAGDDRGWHLVAVAERVQRLAGRDLQRVGLSATVGNAEDLVRWLTRTSSGTRMVVSPRESASARQPEVSVDFVGSLENSATVISRLHRGEKRLVFVDSRARVEELAAELRDREVATYVSHGSLGREERHAAERAFASARDCVIVSTSTLELGIDVGDLDRVIQIDAPTTVASFLQRLGRTGRREGAVSNTLFLATREDAFLQSLGLLRCWEDGFVEPLEPEPLPLHLVVQQLLALVLQQGGVGRRSWPEWHGDPFVLGSGVAPYLTELTDSLVEEGFLFDDNGILGIGERGRETFGRRHFMDLMAVFSEPPMLTVLAGRNEIGQVPVRLLSVAAAPGKVRTLLLGGRDWDIVNIDWRRGVVNVKPSPARGRARWFGDGQGLSFTICQGIRRILAGEDLKGALLSRRAIERLDRLRDEHVWVTPGHETYVMRDVDGSLCWWTFAGTLANIWLARALGDLADQAMPGDLSITLARDVEAGVLRDLLVSLDPSQLTLAEQVAAGAVRRLKFGEALPDEYARLVVERRMRDDESVRTIGAWPTLWVDAGS